MINLKANEVIAQQEPGVWSKTSWIQIGYGVWVNLTLVGVGLSLGFSAVSGPQLLAPDSPIKVTLSERAWIASGLTIASPLGCIICGVLADRYGRRIQLVLCQLPLVIGWACTGTATAAIQIIVGRIISGVGIGMCSGIPRLYVTEITLPSMRGLIGAFSNIAISLGITIQAAMGAYLDWKILSYICCGFSTAVMLSNILLPETPYYILLKNPQDTREKAVHALKKFRSKSYDIRDEIEHLMEYRDVNHIRSRLTLKEKINFLFVPPVCKPFWIVVIYILFGHFAGITIISFYTVEILEESKSTVDPNLGNFILGLARLGSGILTSVLLYKVGKKPLAFASSLGICITTLIIGVYIICVKSPGVYTQICYTFYVMFAALGYFTLPLIIMYELYPLQVRGLLGGITISILNIIIFGATKTYPHVRKIIDFPYIILSFSVVSFLGCFFVFFCLPETKGLTLQEIEEYFNDRRSTLASEREVRTAQMDDIRKKSSILYRKPSAKRSLDRHTVDHISHKSQSSKQSHSEHRYSMELSGERHGTDLATSVGPNESLIESRSSKTSFDYSYQDTGMSNYESDVPEAQYGPKKKSIDGEHGTKKDDTQDKSDIITQVIKEEDKDIDAYESKTDHKTKEVKIDDKAHATERDDKAQIKEEKNDEPPTTQNAAKEGTSKGKQGKENKKNKKK